MVCTVVSQQVCSDIPLQIVLYVKAYSKKVRRCPEDDKKPHILWMISKNYTQ